MSKEQKRCYKCGKTKSTECFSSDSSRKGGLTNKCKECESIYRLNNKDRIKKSKQKYRADNKEYINQYNKENRHKYKESISRSRKKYAQTPKGRYGQYKTNAKNRNLEFNLTFEEFMRFWGASCSYCGNEITTIGLDRINNELGYNISNITACCTLCNTMKMGHSVRDFLKHCQKIIDKNSTDLKPPSQ